MTSCYSSSRQSRRRCLLPRLEKAHGNGENWYGLDVANYISPAKTIAVALLLKSGASLRDAATRARANREAVTRIDNALRDGEPFLVLARPKLRRQGRERTLRTESGASVAHTELVRALMSRHLLVTLGERCGEDWIVTETRPRLDAFD